MIYSVTMTAFASWTIEVEADDEDKAIELAKQGDPYAEESDLEVGKILDVDVEEAGRV